MKLYNVLSTGAAAMLLALTSCQDEVTAVEEQANPNIMTFDIAYPGQQTRVTGNAFESGDRVGLFITQQDLPLEVSGNYVNNASLSFNGAQWEPESPIYWDGGTYNIYAYYPQIESVSSVDNLPVSVATDQQAEGGYEKSDFLWASNLGAVADNTPVSLQFSHRMSRMLIQLVKGEDYEGELPEDAEVYIHNTVPQATIDLSVGIVTRDPYATTQSIRAQSLGNHRYAAIVVPQRLDNRQPLVEVIMQGVSYLYESKFIFKQGIQHNVQLVVSKNPEQIKIEIGGELEDWNN